MISQVIPFLKFIIEILSYASRHCAVVTVTVAAGTGTGTGPGTGDLGNKLIPKSNTTDNMIKMITSFPSFMLLLLLYLLTKNTATVLCSTINCYCFCLLLFREEILGLLVRNIVVTRFVIMHESLLDIRV